MASGTGHKMRRNRHALEYERRSALPIRIARRVARERVGSLMALHHATSHVLATSWPARARANRAAAFAFLFSEVIQYTQKRVNGISDLERR